MPRHVPQPNKPDRETVLRIAGEEAAATGASLESVMGFNRAEGFDKGAANITARHRTWDRVIRETGCSRYGLAMVVGCDPKAVRWALRKLGAAA